MAESKFDAIGTSKEKLLEFFRANFEDVVGLIGEDKLIEQYLTNPRLPLISVKCDPYHYRDHCVIIGDAAHAVSPPLLPPSCLNRIFNKPTLQMVPFYGQGMNAGLEDVRVLFDHIREHPDSIADALTSYTAHRRPDGHCINDLAMRNYVEMRASVTSRVYLLRKFVEESLYAYVPWLGVRTMYSMVSFSNMRYSEVVKKARRQKLWLDAIAGVMVFGGIVGLGAWGLGRRAGGVGTVKAVWRALQQGH